MPLFPLYAIFIVSGVALVLLGPRRLPAAARSAWRVLLDLKQFLDDANREVNNVIKSAWYEYREGGSSGASRLDSIIVIAALAVLIVILTTPAANGFCRDLLLSVLR